MALRRRQVRFYQDRCSIYRRNKNPGATGEPTFSLLAAGVVCKHFTSPNYDTESGAAHGLTLTKEGNIFTADLLHVDAAQDIAAEDFVIVTTGPNTGSKMTWFRVAGEPQTRFGVANRSEVYLVPAVKPVIV